MTHLLRIVTLLLVATATICQAELKDGDSVPARPRDKEANRVFTFSGEKRFYLPTLEKGDGKGFFAFYESRRVYRAFVTEDGGLEIEMLDRNDKPIGKRFSLGGNICGYYGVYDDNKRGWTIPRYMVGLKDDLKPQSNPRRKMMIEALLEEGDKFKRTYEFDRDQIIVYTGIDSDNNKKTYGHMGAWFPAVMSFGRSVEQTEREKALKGWEVRIRNYEGKKRKKVETYEYAKSEFYRGLTDFVEVTGPWGPDRFLRLKTKEDVMRPYIYSGNCPYQGYYVYTVVPADTYNKYDYKLVIEFQ